MFNVIDRHSGKGKGYTLYSSSGNILQPESEWDTGEMFLSTTYLFKPFHTLLHAITLCCLVSFAGL